MIYQLWKHNAIIISEYLYVTKLDMTFITVNYFLFRSGVVNANSQLRMCPCGETPLCYGET